MSLFLKDLKMVLKFMLPLVYSFYDNTKSTPGGVLFAYFFEE